MLGSIAILVDEAFFGGEWSDEAGDWTVGSALFVGLAVAYGYCCGYFVGRHDRR